MVFSDLLLVKTVPRKFRLCYMCWWVTLFLPFVVTRCLTTKSQNVKHW